jgi:hypothetical protein
MQREHGGVLYEVSPVTHVGIVDDAQSTSIYEADATGINLTQHMWANDGLGTFWHSGVIRQRINVQHPGRVLQAMMEILRRHANRVTFYTVSEVA